MQRQRSWKRNILGLGCALVVLAGCGQTPLRVADQRKSTLAGSTASPSLAYPVDGLALDRDELAWSGIRIGMTRGELEKLLALPIAPLEANEICASFVATREIRNVLITFEFPDESEAAPLEHLFIPLDGDLPQTEQILRLKRRLPDVTYVPSRYAPNLAEQDNPKPVYRVATARPRVVMLNANEGLWLGDPRCYD